MACQYSMTRLLRLLMNQPGVSIEQPDYAGCTPLHHACMSTQRSTGLEVVKILVQEYGADPCAKNSGGQTPYDVATIDSIRQYLLPIQLQKETQYALDNGGQGLPPGIDLGGLKINRSNMAPPPQFGGTGVAASPAGVAQSRYPQTPGMASSSNTAPIAQHRQQQQPGQPNIPVSQPIARAPASMPGRSSNGSTPGRSQSSGGYSRSGQSSLAVYSKYKADGFHSSSSDVNLQRKYGHIGTSMASDVPPPPSSGNAPSSGNGAYLNSEPNPFTGAGNLAGVSRYASYGQPLAAAPASVPMRGYGYPVATETAPKFFTPTARNTVPATASAPTPSPSTNGPTSPFMPPPPYSGEATAATNPVAASPGVTQRAPSVSSPFVTSNAGAVSNLFESPPKASDTAETATGITDPASTTIATDEPKQQIDSVVKEGSESNSNDTSSDWIETVDPASGNTYYFNSKTNETSWENPNTTSKEQEATADKTAVAGKETNNASDWTETVDPDSGKSYYYNTKTGETSWEKPSGTIIDDYNTGDGTTDDVTNDDAEWVEATDPSSGNSYYYNTMTGETSWDPPISLDSEQKPTPSDDTAPTENGGKITEAADGAAPTNDLTAVKEEDEKDENESSPCVDVPTKSIEEERDSTVVTEEKQGETLESESSTAIEPTNPEDKIATEPTISEGSCDGEKETTPVSKGDESCSNALLDGWTEATDPSSGKIYYFNADTQETKWDRPVAESTPTDSSTGLTKEEKETSIVAEEKQSESIEEENKANLEEKIPSETTATQDSIVMETETTTETKNGESSSNALLDGWAEATDPSSGKTYYFNADSQETRWDRPVVDSGTICNAETKEGDENGKDTMDFNSAAEAESKAAKGGDLADGWEEVQDPTTGKNYYYNKETQETSWEKPTSTTSEPGTDESALPSEGENDWVETVDPSSGETYYYNAKTGETSWENPSTKAIETQTNNAVASESKPASAEDTFAEPAVDPVLKSEETAGDKPLSSPLAGGLERMLSAEEMFSSPPEVGESNGTHTSSKADKPDFVPPAAAATQGSILSSAAVNTPGSVATTAEDLFGASSTSIPAKSPETKTAVDLFGASTAASTSATLAEPKTAEDLFGANAVDRASATKPELPESKTAEDLFGASTAESSPAKASAPSTAEELFGVPEPLPSQANENTNEDGDEDADMTDIPLTPAPETMVKSTDNLPTVPSTAEVAPAQDLFAAIGMPPPPFQGRR